MEVALKADKNSPGDLLVMSAFSLGWRMADLYRAEQQGITKDNSKDLPGLGSLSPDLRRLIQVDQVTVGIHKFADAISAADLPELDVSAVRAACEKEQDGGASLADSASSKPVSGSESDKEQEKIAGAEFDKTGFKSAVYDLHCALLGELTATDARYGRAYGLGRALCDLCRKPDDADAVVSAFASGRVATLRGWLEELTTAFPSHSAHSVSSSLNNWSAWARDQDVSKANARPLARRQGDLWRAMLSGEKRPQDLLELNDYLDATADAGRQAAKAIRRTVARFALLSIVAVLLVLIGVGLLVVGGPSTDIAGATSLLAAVGLTWKGVGTVLGKLAGRLEVPVWGAVIDRAIGHAVTLVPVPEPAKGDRTIAQRTEIYFDPWTGGSSSEKGVLALQIAAASGASSTEDDTTFLSDPATGSPGTPTDDDGSVTGSDS